MVKSLTFDNNFFEDWSNPQKKEKGKYNRHKKPFIGKRTALSRYP